MRLRWIHRIMKRHGESERQQSTEIGTFPGVCFGKEAVSDPCIASKWVFFLVDNVLLLCFALHCFLSEVGVLHCKSSVVISYSCPEGQYAFVLEVSSSEGIQLPSSMCIAFHNAMYLFPFSTSLLLPRRVSRRNRCQQSVFVDVSFQSLFLESFIVPSSPAKFEYHCTHRCFA